MRNGYLSARGSAFADCLMTLLCSVAILIGCGELLAQISTPSPLPHSRTAEHGRRFQAWPIASQTATSIEDWLLVTANVDPGADHVVIPRLYHVVRQVVVCGTSEESASLFETDLRPELTNWRIRLPAELQSRTALQIWLQLDAPFNERLSPATLQPAGDGSVVLPAREATTHGSKLRFEPQTYKDTVGYWTQAADATEWSFATQLAGDYHLDVLQGCGRGMGGSRLQCVVNGQAIEFEVEETGHFQRFVWRRVGQLELPAASDLRLQLKVISKRHAAVADIRQLRLVPPGPSKPSLDIRDVPADLVVPALVAGSPRAGRRVRLRSESFPSKAVFASLYLPVNWQHDQTFPVFVELPGNGGYVDPFGDVCTGTVGDASLAYGLTGGQDAIWLVVPFLDDTGTEVAKTWWGSPPDYRVQITLKMMGDALDQVCERWGGDADRVVLVGFSRGSLACNYLGLANDDIAARWRSFVCCSHYDGVENSWPYPAGDTDAALRRLSRLGDRRQFVCMESRPGDAMLNRIRSHLTSVDRPDRFVIRPTGFRNHSDRWTLRPSATRQELRIWLADQLK